MFKKPNYTQTPNEFFDDIAKTLKEGELRILLVIMRQTFGWGNKKWDRISISQFAEKTGMDERSISRSLKTLIEKKLVIKISKGPEGEQQSWYSLIVENPEEFEDPIDDSNNFNPCLKVSPPPDLKSDTKETLTKENMSGDSPAPLFPPFSRADAAQKARPSSRPSKEIPKEALEMAHNLFEKVKAIHPKAKPPKIESWAKEFDLLNRRDGRSWQEISEMIDWTFDDAFWVNVIQSPEGLRRNWDKMAVKRAPVTNKGKTIKENRDLAIKIKTWLKSKNEKNTLAIFDDKVYDSHLQDSLALDLPRENFQAIIFKWYGIKGETNV